MCDTMEIWKQHWADFADAFAHPLKANGLFSKFVTNPDVTGAYAEAWVRSMVKSMLPQYRVSTGAIVRATDQFRGTRDVPQCDLIIWNPSELPALFEQETFALVPYHSARAIVEIKRTSTDIDGAKEQLKKLQKCLLHERRMNVLGVVVSHNKSLFEAEVDPDWLSKRTRYDEPLITRLLSEDSTEPDVDGIFSLIYFLSHIAKSGD